MTHAQTYLAFLRLCETEHGLIKKSHANISPELLALFTEIAVKHSQDQPMTVSHAMALKHLASAAALHKWINDLRLAGMIYLIFKGGNRRTKYLIPSEMGEQYLHLMGQLLIQSLNLKH